MLRNKLLEYIHEGDIIELDCMKKNGVNPINYTPTICGKYSSGSLCEHPYVEKVGAFCSFAYGVDVVMNHPVDMISTHPFLYYSTEKAGIYKEYDDNADQQWYFPGVSPRGAYTYRDRRITIGNDVWLGRNVIITNGADIGDGVIAGAGAVITKSVPDYAIVGGVPARIIRYRYSSKQIAALKKIKWWDWDDDIIRERYDDFYLDIESFISKYDVQE